MVCLLEKECFSNCTILLICELCCCKVMNNNIIQELVRDLQKYPKSKLDCLARFHNTSSIVRIAEKNLSLVKSANMPGPRTYSTTQIDEVVNWINSKTRSNICLRHMLVIKSYTDKPKVPFLESHYLDIKPQKYDIYNQPNTASKNKVTDNPWPIIDDLLSVDNPRVCMFVLWLKIDHQQPTLPVIDSHLTLTLFQREQPNVTDVYKYNSSFVSSEGERDMDLLFLEFLQLLQNRAQSHHYNLVQTASWCPKDLQQGTKLCTLYTFNIYHNLNKYQSMSIQEILGNKSQSLENIRAFTKDLTEAVPGLGEHDIDIL